MQAALLSTAEQIQPPLHIYGHSLPPALTSGGSEGPLLLQVP